MTDIESINTILRAQLIAQSGISAELIRDATTEYGSFLDMNSSGSIFESLTPTNTALLFELKTRESSINMSRTNDNDSITFFRAYQLRVILYGDNSGNVANMLVARFRTEKVRNSLLAKGVYVETVSEPERITEFKNNIVWQRNDIEINVSCEVELTQSSIDADFETFDEIHTTKRS